MVYFGRCLRITPEHGEACGTAGFIEESKGNTEKAVAYFEKSLKTAFSKPVALKLRKLKKGVRIRPLIRPRIKLPEYFNQFKYDFPAQCISTGNAVMAEAEHNAFRKMIDQQSKKFGVMYAEVMQKRAQKSMEIMKAGGAGRILRKDEFMAQPFYEQCQIMAGEVLNDYRTELAEFNSKTLKEFALDMKVLGDEYQVKYKIMMDAFEARCPDADGASHANCPTDEEICGAKNRLANVYLPKFAYFTQEVQEKGKRIYNTYFDELVYWHYLALNPMSKDDFRMQYYHFIEEYLTMMGGLCQTKIIKPCNAKSATTTKESNNIKDVDCPLDFGISFVIGSIELDCEKFSIEGGEALVFKYEKDFKNRTSTLHVGIGANIDLGRGFDVGAREYAFIKFDGDGKYSDAGIKTETSAEVGIEKLGIGVKAEVGSTLCIESGWDFNEGPFKNILGPKTETPLNKNVKVYNPG